MKQAGEPLVEVRLATPVGCFVATLDPAGALRAARFVDGDAAPPARAEGRHAAELRTRLAGYFDGDLAALQALPVAPGGTTFQARVWAALRGTVPGRTLSYAALAVQLGLPGHAAARAVGAANAANPIALVVPCHRVIASDGRLLGYAWGVARKRWLLQHEAEHAAAGAAPGPLC